MTTEAFARVIVWMVMLKSLGSNILDILYFNTEVLILVRSNRFKV